MRSAFASCAFWFLGLPLSGQSLLQPLAYGPNRQVTCMLMDSVEDVLYLGGAFGWINDSILSPGVVKWTGTEFEPLGCGLGLSWCDTTWGHQLGMANPVATLAIWNGDLYAGGGFSFTMNGETFNRVAKWDGTEWHPAGDGMDHIVYSLKSYPDALYAAGWFFTADGDSCGGIAKWDGTAWTQVLDMLDLSNDPGANYVQDLEISGDSIYLGGNFQGVGNMHSFAWYNGSTWQGVGAGLNGFTCDVDRMRRINGELVVVGSFGLPPLGSATNAGSGILKTDGYAWTTFGEGTAGAYNPTVRDVVQWNNDLVAVGYFDRMGGVPTDCLSSWDGTRWCSLLPANYLDNTLACAAVFRDTLYIGGGFHTAGGDTIRFVAKYIGTAPDTCGAVVGVTQAQSAYQQLLLFPNPTQDQLHLSNSTPAFATITDATGRQVMAARIAANGTLSVGALASGCYTLHLRDAQQRMLGVVRFLKE